ncbi:MAG: hypothetical protein Q9182_005479 [Xanthomendoza sp. 2 TL-2023]
MPSNTIYNMRRIYRIASIPADGIGPEVIGAGIQVLNKLVSILDEFEIHFEHFEWGSEAYKKTGKYIPDGGLDSLKAYNAILFGAVGDRDVPDYISLWGLRLAICQPFQQYANLRPTRVLRGISSSLHNCPPGSLDWLIVRENTEGEYAGQVLWDEVAAVVAKDFPQVEWDKILVDAMTVRMTLQPETIDTIVATNLHADILSDLAAALAGSIGIAPTSNLDPTREYPSMFEPIHGSAWDIVGKGVANPIATFWTAAEMIRWLGHEEAADGLMKCVENVCERGVKTRDLGGTAGTKEVTEAVCTEIEKVLSREGKGIIH